MTTKAFRSAGRLKQGWDKLLPSTSAQFSSAKLNLFAKPNTSCFRYKTTLSPAGALNTADEPFIKVPELKRVPAVPFLGSMIPQISGIPGDIMQGYSFWPQMRQKYGDFYTVGFPAFGNPDCTYGTLHVLTDPREMVAVIRSGGSFPSGVVEFLWVSKKWNEERDVHSRGILERGPEWKRIRTFLQTDLLHPESARGYIPGMIQAAELASAGAAASRNGLNAYLERCAFDLFSTIMFGELTQLADPTTPTHPENETFATKAVEGLSSSIEMLMDPYENVMHKLGITTSKCKVCFSAFDATWDIASAKLDAFSERRERNELTENEKNSYFARALDRQLDPSSELSIKEAKELCFIGLSAAVDTTSSVLGWNLFHIARCPNVQETLHDELQNAVRVAGKYGKLSVEALSREHVPYLHAVIRETQRLTPPSPIFVSKQLDRDDVIIHNHPLKKGDVVAFEGFSSGMIPELVDNPEVFQPERWLPDAVAARKGTPKEIIDHPFFKEPFSQGARKCPGSRVAANELQVMLSQLVLDWKMSSPVSSMKDITYHQGTMIVAQLPPFEFEARQ